MYTYELNRKISLFSFSSFTYKNLKQNSSPPIITVNIQIMGGGGEIFNKKKKKERKITFSKLEEIC